MTEAEALAEIARDIKLTGCILVAAIASVAFCAHRIATALEDSTWHSEAKKSIRKNRR